MNIQWKNEKELTRHSARRYGGEGMPSGMRPAYCKSKSFKTAFKETSGLNDKQVTEMLEFGKGTKSILLKNLYQYE